MKEKDIHIARNNYKKLLQEENKLKKVKEELLILEKNPDVQRYIKLLNKKIQSDELTDEERVYKSFRCSRGFEEYSNEILVFIGKGEVSYFYKDLETTIEFEILTNEKKQFEQSKKIIYPQIIKSTYEITTRDYDHAYEMIQLQFYKYLLEMSQEEAVNKILEENQKVKVKK